MKREGRLVGERKGKEDMHADNSKTMDSKRKENNGVDNKRKE